VTKLFGKSAVSYWSKKLGDMDYSEEGKIETALFKPELWKGMMGNKPYPTVRSGADLRKYRKALLAQYHFVE
jgi:hypothetical protein